MVTKQSKYQRIITLLFDSFMRVPYLSRWMVLLMDIFIVIISFTISSLVCFQLIGKVLETDVFLYKMLLNLSVTILFFVIFHTYRGIIRYTTFVDIMRIFSALLCSSVIMFGLNYLLSEYYRKDIYIEQGFFINFILTFSAMILLRMFVKLLYDFIKKRNLFQSLSKPILIVGVDTASVAMAAMIESNISIPYHLAGFISLDVNAADKTILNVPVYGKKSEYEKILKKGSVKTILINPKSLERKEKQELSDFCIENRVQMLVTPPLEKWQGGTQKIKDIKEIQIEDLLGRIPIEISTEAISKDLKGKCIMITGAAGSIGSEIVRQISLFEPGLLLLCDIAETPMHQLTLELKENFPDLHFLPVICDVRNHARMEKIFKMYQPQHVYHAAAYKHVPLMEDHPSESILTNVFGTKNMADLAIRYKAEAFVMISTDKAVNPTNVMGTSKRIAEIYVQSLQDKLASEGIKGLRFITTRFGNVLGSNGSVIPRFKEQIAKGGPVTVTHPEIIRYFMTIPEACRLVLEAANMGKGGEIFVFDMGDPVKIVDLAKKMIRLSGLIPYEEIEIVFTGLRPGEKLYEELLADEEMVKPTYNRKIKIGNVRPYAYEKICRELSGLLNAAKDTDDDIVVKLMKEIVPEFHIDCHHHPVEESLCEVPVSEEESC